MQLSPDFIQRLLTAADRGDVSKIKQILSTDEHYSSFTSEQQYIDFFSTQLKDEFCNQTIFHIACNSGRPEILKLLLMSERDSKKNEDDYDERQETTTTTTTKSVAIPSQFNEARRKILTSQDSDGWCPLHICVVNGNTECFDILTDPGIVGSSSSSDESGRGCNAIIDAMLSVKGLGGTPLDVANEQNMNEEIRMKLRKFTKTNNNNFKKSDCNDDEKMLDHGDEERDDVTAATRMVELQRAQLVQQQQVAIQQMQTMIHQLEIENRDLNFLLQKEKEEHKKTKERCLQLEATK